MPKRLRYDAAKRINYVTIADPFGLADLRDVLRDLTESSNHPPDVDTIWDGRAVDFGPIDRTFAEAVVQLVEEFPDRGRARVAFVVSSDLGFGMARMFEALSVGVLQDAFVCRSLAEAESWLAGGRDGTE